MSERFIVGYTLEHEPIFSGEWERFEAVLRDPRRVVDRTRVGRWVVSTVFLSTDYGFGHTLEPILYETMIFHTSKDGPASDFMQRYAHREQAAAAHKIIVELIESGDFDPAIA